ncbi:MAG: ATP-dependent protease subunit HslV [Calditrichaeota bacterium]|nr:ATP-dependent protease subunit HslV [Calditrichota bacterium]MCB9391386.1 ATP-dependent protease subunit HslV [Calditrichota bacterium]
MNSKYHGTTILAVRRNGQCAICGDGQLTLDDTIIKSKGRKVRKIFEDQVLVGYAGGAADALALLDIFEGKLKQHNGNLTMSALDMAKEWRMDRNLRRLEADMVVMDKTKMYLVSGLGEVIEPDDDLIALGSGGSFALSAARALYQHTEMSAKDIACAALEIASQICVFTNSNLTIEVLGE